MRSLAREASQVVQVCRQLHARNFLAAADGNVSVRVAPGKLLITPSGLHKGFLKTKDLALMDSEGHVIRGNPSSERLMHLEVYRSCPKARAVVHAHPPVAIAWSVARPSLKELPSDGLSEVILAVGRIPIVPYARPSTRSMGDRLVPFLKSGARVMILGRHGALSWGESLDEAYNGMERLEHSAQILMNAELLGGITSLGRSELAYLRALRAKLGERTL